MKTVFLRTLLGLYMFFLSVGTGRSSAAATGAPDACIPPAQCNYLKLVGQLGGVTNAIAIQGNFAYVGVGPRLIVLDISTPSQPHKVGETAADFDIVRDVVARGSHLYIAGGYTGLRVVSVADPANPIDVGRYDTSNAVDLAVNGNYAYVADKDGGLQIM